MFAEIRRSMLSAERAAAAGARTRGQPGVGPGSASSRPCSPLLSSAVPSPGGLGHRAQQPVPAFSVFRYPCWGDLFPARRRLGPVLIQPLEGRGKRAELSQLGRNAGRAPPPSRSPILERVLTSLFVLAPPGCVAWLAAIAGDGQPPSKPPVKEVSQPLGAPTNLRLLLLLGTPAGAPWGAREREFSCLQGEKWPPGAGSECRVLSERQEPSFPVGWCSDVMRALTF